MNLCCRVGWLILVTNSPREQKKKKKVYVCSVLVNKKKNYKLGSIGWMIFEHVVYFWEFFEVLLYGGMLMWLGLL
jgi:hypothetical protein